MPSDNFLEAKTAAKCPSRGIRIIGVIEIIIGVSVLLFGLWCLWLAFFRYGVADGNESTGFALMFAVAGLLLGTLMLLAGKRLKALKSSGWVLNLILGVLLLPASIVLIVYLLNKNVREQFRNRS